MKIQVRNLGVIKEAEVDLKPLTVFIGPNNAGKTWLAYTLFAILGSYANMRYARAYTLEKVQEAYPPLDTAIQQVLDEGNATVDLVKFADEYGETYINNVALLARQWMRQYMNTVRASFESLEAHLSLGGTKEDFLRKVLAHSQENKLSVGQRRRGPLLSTLKESGKRELYIYTSTEGDISEKLPQRVVKEFLVDSLFRTLHIAIYSSMYTFPTERSSIVLNLNDLQKITSTSAPVDSFIAMMANMFRISTLFDRELAAKTTPAIGQYIQLAKLLEKTTLGGSVDFSTPTPDPQREILFRPTEDVTLEISVVSSMVKELAPLVLYLRYLAQPGELLIIDEPEMNLHPKAQVQLIEFLAMLVEAGLQVLITTHSPYIVDHLTNLMKAAERADKEVIRNKFYLQRAEAFISKKNVSVYLFEQEKARNILGEDGLIDWGTFNEVSKRINDIYFEL